MRILSRPPECCAPVVSAPPLADAERERWVAQFRALGDATRLEILRLITAQPEPICVCDIVARCTVSQPTISHHLRVLREAGLVRVSRRGVWAYYAPDPAGLAALRGAVAHLAGE